jgi:hypothetical protein
MEWESFDLKCKRIEDTTRTAYKVFNALDEFVSRHFRRYGL